MQVLKNCKLVKDYLKIRHFFPLPVFSTGPESLKLFQQNIVFGNLRCFVLIVFPDTEVKKFNWFTN